MNPENFVTSENLSNKLKDDGVEQTSIMYWDDGYLRHYENFTPEHPYHYAAFTASEITARYPVEIWVTVGESTMKRKEGVFLFVKQGTIYKVSLMLKNGEGELFELQRFENENEAEARGQMLHYLKQQKMI